MDDVAIAPLPVDAKLPPALDVAAMADAHAGLESPTSTEQIAPMDAVAMEEIDKPKDATVAPTTKSHEVAAVVEGLCALKIETIDAPEPASSKVSAMVDEIKTLLNSPTKIPSLSKPDKPSMIPPPSPVAKTTAITHAKTTKGAPSPFAHLKRKSMSPTQKDALAARLYTKAMELKHKRDELSTQAPEECTFKPNTTKPHIKHTSSDAMQSSGPSSVTSNGSDKDRFNMLHDQAKELARRKEAQKQSAQAEYSFKPEISKKSRRMSLKLRLRKAHKGESDATTISSPRSVDGKPTRRHEELYAQHLELAARRKQKQLEMEAKTAEECTFQPKIKKLKGKSPAKSRPLYDAERERLKRLEKEEKKKQFEMAECTFRPAVQRTKSTEAKADDKSFLDRMQENERKKEDRLEALRKEQDERKLKEATFRPKIIETKSSKALADDKPFHERLFDKEYLLQQQADRERKKLEQESFSFKPSIESSLVSIPERHGSIFERLHDEGLKKMEQLSLAEQQRLKREMEECTFHPHVSIELKEPPTEPVWERLSNDKKHILEERQRLKEENEAKGCTFKPDLGASMRSPARRNTTLLPPSTSAPATAPPDVSPPSSIARQLRRQTSPQLDLPVTALVDVAAVLTTDDTSMPPAAPSLLPPFPPVVGDEVSEQSRSILDNYDSWAATLEEKMRELK
ncbi:hypothetical protein SDRG_16936 [Saprolegnia diclina VS20]|uniref:Uncharacterized protein n=1 Tax=Saprolegnia diclina (strain VS20) TaxID=1156394 RepID=T0PVX9_SAPDV|nr:hypothetical protein SDRG_16936 [Saprolegnia diclina VS20]EQC25185.1 hypothetical protein SDRG_16936 [Saprolegnia diclina VS20]|eukprot:XP_008621384.1 hypothetical protein SDRG_16936 [Saprolegnia diclina VS20]